MRSAKNSLVIHAERDIPLLRQVRNSKFVSHDQLYELQRFSGSERSRDSFGWRVRRIVKAGLVEICEGPFESPVYRITHAGLALLEHHGQFTTVLHSNTAHLPHPSQAFHSLELNQIRLALVRENVLANWQTEIEVASFNTISCSPFQKDYDAIVDVWIGDRKRRFALEYERTLKSYRRYASIRASLEAEREVSCILYLTGAKEMLTHLVHEFHSIARKLAFANASDFERTVLSTRVVTAGSLAGAPFSELLA